MSTLNCIFGIDKKEGSLYYATKAAINEKSDYIAIDETISGSVELRKRPAYNLCYEISPNDDIIRSRDMDEKMKRCLKGRWNEDIIISSSFLLYENEESKAKNFFPGLVATFSSDDENGSEEATFSEILSTLKAESLEIPYSMMKLVLTVDADGDRKHLLRVLKLNDSQLLEADVFEVFPVKYSRHHPLFDFKNSIFKSFNETWEILKLANLHLNSIGSKLPEMKELLRVAENYSTNTYRHPFIVIEGLDGVGKTTLVRNLSIRLKAPEIKNPPEAISQYRENMTKQCQPLCRAFFSLGNYLVAEKIKDSLKKSPVVLDRFWHSTAAYAIAIEAKCGDEKAIPPAGNSVYQWPSNLLKPTAVFFLELSEDERQKRLTGRGGNETEEESQLRSCPLLQRRLMKAYKNMANPSCIVIDASKSEDEVCEDVVREMMKRNILSYNISPPEVQQGIQN
ncbi:UMP-CMP kinase 2, mitochondrial-like [Dendronephthya gigantea]|uniref:UMP-CMP kinase 2, mitochondrial-like n=1 Tax=Dendronephthya gigantea TaxID=151771 RepID=UPI00106B06A3|nr:UMP-CMP kinase 2, mitochondrial-like [Dendronephthya gigantea]